MVEIVKVSRDELIEQRDTILKDVGLTREELGKKAENYQLAGDEWTAWDEVKNIEFLLGDSR